MNSRELENVQCFIHNKIPPKIPPLGSFLHWEFDHRLLWAYSGAHFPSRRKGCLGTSDEQYVGPVREASLILLMRVRLLASSGVRRNSFMSSTKGQKFWAKSMTGFSNLLDILDKFVSTMKREYRNYRYAKQSVQQECLTLDLVRMNILLIHCFDGGEIQFSSYP